MERELVFIRLVPQTLPGDKWKVSSPTNVSRAKIPGGWLVGIESGNVRSWGLTFVPTPSTNGTVDPFHRPTIELSVRPSERRKPEEEPPRDVCLPGGKDRRDDDERATLERAGGCMEAGKSTAVMRPIERRSTASAGPDSTR